MGLDTIGRAEQPALLERTRAGAARREAILEAALRVFSELGFAKATIKRIAAAAGLRSPALIYWYFENKEELLRGVLERYALPLTAAQRVVVDLDMAPEQVLPAMAGALLAFFHDPKVRQVWRLGISEYQLVAELGVAFRADTRPDNLSVFLQGYLDRQVELGRLVPHDTRASTQSFLAQLWMQVQASYFFPGIYQVRPDEEFLATFVPLFLGGLLGSRPG